MIFQNQYGPLRYHWPDDPRTRELRAEVARLRAAVEAMRVPHRFGCMQFRAGELGYAPQVCYCGAAEWNDKIDAALKETT